MISLQTHMIMEANKKRPSGLGRIKDTSKEETINVIAGDIYDLSRDNTYTERFRYYSGEGNGYITDKDDHVYDVIINTQQGDAGRIAGGSTHRYVTIKNVNGKDIKLSGWTAVFSTPHGETIISDIKAGMYLEDYLAKNWDCIDGDSRKDEKIIKMRDEGNPNAKTYVKQREESAEERAIKFWQRYILINTLTIAVENGTIKVNTNDIDYHYQNKQGNKKPTWNNDMPEDFDLKQAQEEWDIAFEEYQASIITALIPIIETIFAEKFNCTLADMNGLFFTMQKNDTYLNQLGFDTKLGRFVTVQYNSAKLAKDVDKDKAMLEMGPTVTLIKSLANDHMIKIFTDASKEWLKINRGKQSEWIDKHWRNIWNNGNRNDWLYGQQTMTKGEARKQAAEGYKKEINDHNWKTSGDKITFMTEFISQFMTDPEKIEKITGTEIEDVDMPRRGQNTVMGKDAWAKQSPKMDAWHNGTRNQNVKNCSDAKLRLNYQICKDKGYTKEMDILKAEADKRGIVLESLSLREYTRLF